MGSKELYQVIGTKDSKEHVLAAKLNFEEAMMVIQDQSGRYDSINISQEYMVEDKSVNLLAISDAKMMLEETKALLERPEKFNEQLIFLGNFIDKGPGFYDYMTYLIDLNNTRDCIFVKGKNEHNILQYINQTEHYVGSIREVSDLIESIEKELSFPLYSLEERFPDFYQLLSRAVDFYENDHYIFTSGGIDLEIETWKQSEPEELFETTETFLKTKNHTGKKIVFGSIPLTYLNRSQIINPWFNRTEDKIGINGDCKRGGKLLGLFIHDDVQSFMGIRNLETKKNNSKRRKQLSME